MDAHRLLTVKTGNIVLQPNEVDFLRQEISTQEQSIATLLSECKAFKALLAPLRRQVVPPEILGEIFYLAIQAEPDSGRSTIDQQILDICLVCKAWRSVALGAPRLWCTIEDFPLDARLPGNFDRVEAWFKRSGSLPKTIELCERDHVYRISGDPRIDWELCPLTASPLIDFLTQGPRLEKVILSCMSVWCFQELVRRVEATINSETLPPRQCPWNSMKCLDLRIELGFWNEYDEAQVDILRRLSPSLTQFHLNIPDYDDLFDVRLTPLPISSPYITTLKLTLSHWPMHWIFLCAEFCVSLQCLTLDLRQKGIDWGMEGTWIAATGSVVKSCYTLPHLRTLRLKQFPDRYSTPAILTWLSTPCLRDLDTSFDCPPSDPSDDGDGPDDPEFAEDMAQFMHSNSGSTDTLRRLRIHGIVLPWTTLQSVLETVPSVTRLTLDAVSFEFDPEELCLVWPDSLLPSLHSLEILRADDTFDCQPIFSFVQARCEKKFHSGTSDGVRHLKVSKLRSKPTFDLTAKESTTVNALRQQGIDVEIVLEDSSNAKSKTKE